MTAADPDAGPSPSPSPAIDVLVTDFAAYDGWEPCLRSLLVSGHDLRLNVVVARPGETADVQVVAPDIVEIEADGASDGLGRLRARDAGTAGHVVVVARPVVVPPGFLDNALRIVAYDLRVATVSLFSNDAGYLSFPGRNHPASHQVEDLDEVSVTRRLRERNPEQLPATIPLAVGPLALLAGPAVDALGELPRCERGQRLVSEVSIAAQLKGFVSMLDPSTFCTTPHDLGWSSRRHADPRLSDRERLVELALKGAGPDDDPEAVLDPDGPLELGNIATLVAEDEISNSSPLGMAHLVARAKVLGLRVGIDGTCLGSRMMGTQVQTLAIIEALRSHDEVKEVVVAVTGVVPGYARPVFEHEKVKAVVVPEHDLGGTDDLSNLDVLHRPFQPVFRIDVESWRKAAHRTAVSILDVIAYRNAAYHYSGESWLGYREAIRSTLAAVDGATVISADVKQQMLVERLPMDANRIHVVELGTDHLTGQELERPPADLFERGFVADEFLVVLGASYAHKNRDLAIRAVQELRRRGRSLGLVLVGATVPHGSSRQLEARALGADAGRWLWTVPDVAAEERNWLLAHAAAVLYPTSAEGFGFVPFEAARFSTPTVCVPFGPLVELAPDMPVSAPSWDPMRLADAVEELVSDPTKSRAHIAEILTAGSRFTWDRTASLLVDFYREILAHPAR